MSVGYLSDDELLRLVGVGAFDQEERPMLLSLVRSLAARLERANTDRAALLRQRAVGDSGVSS